MSRAFWQSRQLTMGNAALYQPYTPPSRCATGLTFPLTALKRPCRGNAHDPRSSQDL